MTQARVREPVGADLVIGSLAICKVSLGGVGFDGGDPIDNTCLMNAALITKQPQLLVGSPDVPFTGDYHPEDTDDVLAEINVNQLILLTLRDIGTVSFWGYLKSFEPKETGKGEGWRAAGVIVVTNADDEGDEVAPTFGAGTPTP
jgi:hypothetical protein